jgi:acetyl-CoA decarbonylase/synthase, CODH/ACS complex subunit gamma
MALSGLDIYKLLPRTNCKECGFATCLAFAMALAQKKASLDKCPHVTREAREALESASQPPIKLVTIGTGDGRIEIGNETVMYRHEQKFYHPAAVGVLIEDTLGDAEISKKISDINALKFERVGQQIGANIICICNSSKDIAKFKKTVEKVKASTGLNIALYSNDAAAVNEALESVKDKRPLIIAGVGADIDSFINTAKANKLPLGLTAADIDTAAELADRAKKAGVEEIVINPAPKGLAKRIQDYTYIRRSALKKNFRPLGYPIISFTESADPALEMSEAVTYVLKYSSVVIMKNTYKEFVYPVLVARQDIYNDPQKPVQVQPKVYEIGKPDPNSPLLVTTNFSITYFTVAAEVESSKVPSYILACDSEGMSVLTAWAAEKFTAESITAALKKAETDKVVSHRKVIIPGYVSVLSGKLEELSDWKVSVGPREASGITNYLRNWK